MFLKTLHIAGFKSFAQPVRIDLDLGITAVVGPNGSGKSNIVDAVRWVLGEQSARAIRGARSEDVIFSGSAARHAQGMAEVSLVLDNGDGRVAIDLAEVAIARRLYRSGETEYRLNNRRARLRDVLDVAGQAGLGPDSYCVVGQGAIEQLVMQRPQERRALIADAADVRRHEARLAEIESSLAETQQNALRISAVVAELRPQLERVRRQAERAEQHHRVREEAERTARAWFGRAVPSARSAVEAAERRRLELQAAIAGLRGQAATAEGHRAAAQARLRELRASLAAEQQAWAKAVGAREAIRIESAGLGERRLALEARIEELRAERDELTSRVQEARQAAVASRREFDEAEGAGATERLPDGALLAADEALRTARKELADGDREVEECRGVVEGLERQAVRVRSEQEAAEAAAQVRAARQREVEARLADLTTRLAAGEQEIANARAALGGAEEGHARARPQHSRCLDLMRKAAEVANTALRQLDRLVGEEQALAALLAKPSHEETANILLSLLPTAPRYRHAIAAALGASARSVVIDADETAWHVDRVASGSPVLVPARRSLPVSPPMSSIREAVAAFGIAFHLAVDLLEDHTHAELAQRYLGSTIIVEGLAEARLLARQLAIMSPQWFFQITTLDGHCLRWNGEHALGPDPAALHDLELQAKQAQLVARLATAQSASRDAEISRASAHEAERLAADALRVAEDRRRLAATTLNRAQEQVRGLQAERQREQSELGRTAGSAGPRLEAPALATLADQLAAATKALQVAQQVRQARVAEVDGAEVALRAELGRRADREADRAVHAERIERLRQNMVRDEREVQALADREGRLEADLAKTELELRDQQSRREASAASLALVEMDAAASERRVGDNSALVAQEDLATAEAIEALETLQAHLAELREQEAEIAADVERSRGMVARLEVEVESAAEQLASSSEELLTHNLNLPTELVRLDDEVLQRRVVRALRELRGVGNVDYGVLAEHRTIQDRYTYLTEQLDDLGRAEQAIREGMEEARQRIQEQFTSAFDLVNERFKELFRDLFRGGDAELLISGEPDRPQTGVEIVAQPPGKRLHRLATLSGGERALVGAALLLALISANPSPFCMLDEVDAALDETNVQRFVATVREMAHNTQFILVTHNRATMEMADALYGVTMNPGAVSQVLAIRLPS